MSEPQLLDVEESEQTGRGPQRSLSVGEWVEVRSKQEILATLDKNGQLAGLPFMPEMFAFCGKRFRVFKRAHKTCDTVNDYKGRKMKNTVHLDGLRCNGESHGGCEASCLLFWNTAWLRRVSDSGVNNETEVLRGERSLSPKDGAIHCTEADILASTKRLAADKNDHPSYVCQATQLPAASEPLSPWSLGQYLEDYTSGNVDLGKLTRGLIFMSYVRLINLGIGLGASLRWLYDQFQGLRKGIPYPLRAGQLPLGGPTPIARLDLRDGEWVRVKSHKEILATCNENLINRGMSFDKEMVPYCGGTYRVLKRVTRILNERTGKMQDMKNPCIILDGVVCQARYSDCRLFCPRSIYPYWREIWLERVSNTSNPQKETISLSTVRKDSRSANAEQVLM
jgi:hypothetical protein